jgi:methionyl aminopeptidase
MITIKSSEEIEILKEGGHKLALILNRLAHEVRPGVTTGYLEDLALKMIAACGGRPSFKDYPMGGDLYFPTALCASINNEVVHGGALPSRTLKSGDIIDLDIGMQWPAENGLYTDTCRTVAVGKISQEAKKLIKVSYECLVLALKQVKEGNTINDIGRAVQYYAENHGYGVVRDLVGHGVGYAAHEAPHVFNYEIEESSPDNITLLAGMVLAIEPMINVGTWKVKTDKNGFTILTADGSISAHFEHTIVVTKTGYKIITI